MDTSIVDIIRSQSASLDPIPTGVDPLLNPLPDIRAVLFDVYGTLFISGSGEVGTAADAGGFADAFAQAIEAVEIEMTCPGSKGVARLRAMIEKSHKVDHQLGIEYPEVDILDVWAKTLGSLFRDGLISHAFFTQEFLEELAAQYEVRVNPVWPMPGAADCLATLRRAGLLLGIISNAQFFTPALFPALLNAGAEQLGFHPQLQFYSYRFKRAKPGRFLYERAADKMKTLGVEPPQVLFVGNDMLNDVAAAAGVGFRTALFAGDSRSLRLRETDERVQGVSPDLVLTHWNQLPGCVLDERPASPPQQSSDNRSD